MKLIHIVGYQNSGKTTLISELITELVKRGLKIGTIKHSSHDHELDKKGKDSFMHRKAGASPASIICTNMTGIFFPNDPEKDPFDEILPMYHKTDLVIVEGFIDGPYKKIEVFRKETKTEPRANTRKDISAIITNDPINSEVPLWPRNDIYTIADNLCHLLDISP